MARRLAIWIAPLCATLIPMRAPTNAPSGIFFVSSAAWNAFCQPGTLTTTVRHFPSTVRIMSAGAAFKTTASWYPPPTGTRILSDRILGTPSVWYSKAKSCVSQLIREGEKISVPGLGPKTIESLGRQKAMRTLLPPVGGCLWLYNSAFPFPVCSTTD